jgi:hypothetical protein
MSARGYLAPPSSITKLYNFAAIDSWTGCHERLVRAVVGAAALNATLFERRSRSLDKQAYSPYVAADPDAGRRRRRHQR